MSATVIKFPEHLATYKVLPHPEECGDQDVSRGREAMMKEFHRRPRAKRRTSQQKSIHEFIELAIAPLRRKIAALEEKTKEPAPPKLGSFDQWLASKEAQEFAGKHVAWLGGIVAIGDNADDLMDKLLGDEREEQVSIAIVPKWQPVKV